MEDVNRVPKVEKSMMRTIQRKDPFPYGDALCVPLDEVTEFRQTSGTTGNPIYQPDTWRIGMVVRMLVDSIMGTGLQTA